MPNRPFVLWNGFTLACAIAFVGLGSGCASNGYQTNQWSRSKAQWSRSKAFSLTIPSDPPSPAVVPPPQTPDEIIVTAEGTLFRNLGQYTLKQGATILDLLTAPNGPILGLCFGELSIVRKENGLVMVYSTHNPRYDRTFKLQHGDRIIYKGGGL